MISFDDSITARNLPAGQGHGIFYGDGHYANGTAVKQHLGAGAKLMCVTVFGATGKQFHIVDCEKGDVSPAGAVAWVEKQLSLGVYRPCVYANQSTWNGYLKGALAKHGAQIKRWLALYDNIAAVPLGYDAKQYSNPGPVDKNVALESFFDLAPKPQPSKPTTNSGVAMFSGSVDLSTGQWRIWGVGAPGVVFAGAPGTWNAAVSLTVGNGGGGWDAKGKPAT